MYALGATLYAIRTGRAPYAWESATEVIDRVNQGPTPAPPAVAGRVPKPLDTVCRKAMSRNEDDRYTTLLELAADVERWLADESVSAYRAPLVTRARRWVARHRTAVATALATALVIAVALSVVVLLLAAKNRELTDKTEAANPIERRPS